MKWQSFISNIISKDIQAVIQFLYQEVNTSFIEVLWLKSEPILNPVHDLFFRVKTANIQCLFQWAKDKKVIWRKIQAIGEYFNTDNRNFMRFLIENVEVHPPYESMTVHLLRVPLSLSNVFVCTHMYHVVISSHIIQ